MGFLDILIGQVLLLCWSPFHVSVTILVLISPTSLFSIKSYLGAYQIVILTHICLDFEPCAILVLVFTVKNWCGGCVSVYYLYMHSELVFNLCLCFLWLGWISQFIQL
ncbi:hypothetical protein ACB092_09G081100 [Castanea dentata]